MAEVYDRGGPAGRHAGSHTTAIIIGVVILAALIALAIWAAN